MNAIGIDIGTTSICGVVIDIETGEVKKSLTKNSNAFLKTENEWEKIQSVDKIISVAMDVTEEFIDEKTISIGVTGQMHGIVYTDKDGNAVSPLYTWQDGRGNLRYKNTTYAKYLNSFSGYGNVTDFYNRENGIRPESAVNYCTIYDYFVMKLCNRQTPIIHSSSAASFGLYDLKENKFNYDYIAEIIQDYYIAGYYKNIPVAVAIGDNQASVFSTMADEDSVLLNIGTGSQISVISDQIIGGENIEIRPYFENKYLVVGAALCGGRAYSMLKDFYSEIIGYVQDVEDKKIYEVMSAMLKKASKSNISVDTRFAGTRKNTGITGSITGIDLYNFNPSSFTYGVLEGIVSELYGMYQEMGIKKTGIIGSGNGIRKNPDLVRIFEEKFNSKMKIPAHIEEAAYGAALFSLVSCGKFKNVKEVQKNIKYIKEKNND